MKTENLTKLATRPNSLNRIFLELEGMKHGYTKVIHGMVVTRWSSSIFELGTIGKRPIDIDQAGAVLLAHYKRDLRVAESLRD